MKVDQMFIEELKVEAQADLKGAKAKLADYAMSSFNVKLIKTKTIDNMVIDLEEAVKNIVVDDTPIGPEDGLSPAELIAAMEQIDGTNPFQEEAHAAVDKVQELLKTGAAPVIDPIKIGSPLPKAEPIVQITPDVAIVSGVPLVDKTIEEAVKEIHSSEMVDLGKFTPTILMLGRAPGYTNLPYWIYQWIVDNPDWKSRPDDCPQHSARAVLKSLIFYIQKDGSVRIRETRNSRFHVLE